MEQEFITEEARIEIDAHLKEHGVFFVIAADIDPKITSEQSGSGKVYTKIDDGYVYTIGFTSIGLPEVVVFTGPLGENAEPITELQMRDRLQSATDFIVDIFRYQGAATFYPDVIYDTESASKMGLHFIVGHDGDLDPSDDVKISLFRVLCEYYGNTDFKIRSFIMRKDTVQ